MRRRVGIVLIALWLHGCGQAKSTQTQLRMWLVGSEAQARTINELARPFTQRTKIQVRCEAIAWGEAHSKYLTAVAGQVEPDLGAMGLTWGAEFGRLGALIDLRQAFAEEVAGIQRNTFPGLWASVEQGQQVFGIPFDVTLQTLYYRRDLIPTPPQTWEELTMLLQRLGAENRRMIIDWGNLSWIGYAPFLWQAGGDFYNAQKTAAALNTPQAFQAMEFFRDLYTQHGVLKTMVPIEQGLQTGEFPLVMSGNWKLVSLSVGVPDIAGRWTIAPLPRGPAGKRTAFLGGRTLGIFNRSSHQAEAWQFIRYLFEPTVQAALYQAGLKTQDAYLPPNMNSWEALTLEPEMKTVLQQQARDAKGPPAVPGWTETTHVLESAIQRIVLQKADVKTELGRVNEELNRQLAKSASRP